MTTEEKLKHFMDVSIQSATSKSSKMIDDYTNGLNKVFEDHKINAVRKADLQIKIGTDSLQKEKNKELSKEQIKIKKEMSKIHEQRKNELFTEVRKLLEQFMTTGEYQDLLVKQIKEAKEFARNEAITIYIDPADFNFLTSLETATNCPITVSENSFLGGTRAVIPSKNILIDNSFETKLKEKKEAFTFINK